MDLIIWILALILSTGLVVASVYVTFFTKANGKPGDQGRPGKSPPGPTGPDGEGGCIPPGPTGPTGPATGPTGPQGDIYFTPGGETITLNFTNQITIPNTTQGADDTLVPFTFTSNPKIVTLAASGGSGDGSFLLQSQWNGTYLITATIAFDASSFPNGVNVGIINQNTGQKYNIGYPTSNSTVIYSNTITLDSNVNYALYFSPTMTYFKDYILLSTTSLTLTPLAKSPLSRSLNYDFCYGTVQYLPRAGDKCFPKYVIGDYCYNTYLTADPLPLYMTLVSSRAIGDTLIDPTPFPPSNNVAVTFSVRKSGTYLLGTRLIYSIAVTNSTFYSQIRYDVTFSTPTPSGIYSSVKLEGQHFTGDTVEQVKEWQAVLTDLNAGTQVSLALVNETPTDGSPTAIVYTGEAYLMEI